MSSEPPIIARGTVRLVNKNNTWDLEMPNGKIVIGHLARDLKGTGFSPVPDEIVRVEMTPFDFSTGRITGYVDHSSNDD